MTFVDLAELPADLAARRVLGERQAAAFLGLSESKLERLRRLQPHDAPRHVRLSERRLGYRVSDLEAWLADRAAA